jgi:hypothetical protein
MLFRLPLNTEKNNPRFPSFGISGPPPRCKNGNAAMEIADYLMLFVSIYEYMNIIILINKKENYYLLHIYFFGRRF